MHYSKIVLGLLFCATLIFFSNCKEDQMDITITGTLYDSCGGTPMANVTLEFGDAGYISTNIFRPDVYPEKRGTATTDKDGKFTFIGNETISNGYIAYKDNRICAGRFVLGQDGDKMDVGKLYTLPQKIKTNYTFINFKDWKNGEYVVGFYISGDSTYRETFNKDNSKISGTRMYSTGTTYYGTKTIHNPEYSSVDTVSNAGLMRYTWFTKKHRGTELHFFHSIPCFKDSIQLKISSDL